MSSTNTNTDTVLANKYQQKTDKQHILDNPDTYIGSVEEVDSDVWIINDDTPSDNVAGCKIIEKKKVLQILFDKYSVNQIFNKII
jgi:hypothetical protein